jgi:hypothetical protein
VAVAVVEQRGIGRVIFRIWHGWTTPGGADADQRIVREEIFAMIAARRIAGYRGIDLLRRTVTAFVGADHEPAFVPPRAQAVLRRYDRRAAHDAQIRHIDYAEGGSHG